MVSNGPSKPTVCVPGMDPARVDETSIGASYPASRAAFSRLIAVPEGASTLAAWCGLVDPSAELLVTTEQSSGPFDNALKQIDPQREVGCDDDADSGAVDHLSQRVFVVVPPGGSDHRVDSRLRQTWHVHHGCLSRREIDRDVDSAETLRLDPLTRLVVVDVQPLDHLDIGCRGGQGLDLPAHAAVSDNHDS